MARQTLRLDNTVHATHSIRFLLSESEASTGNKPVRYAVECSACRKMSDVLKRKLIRGTVCKFCGTTWVASEPKKSPVRILIIDGAVRAIMRGAGVLTKEEEEGWVFSGRQELEDSAFSGNYINIAELQKFLATAIIRKRAVTAESKAEALAAVEAAKPAIERLEQASAPLPMPTGSGLLVSARSHEAQVELLAFLEENKGAFTTHLSHPELATPRKADGYLLSRKHYDEIQRAYATSPEHGERKQAVLRLNPGQTDDFQIACTNPEWVYAFSNDSRKTVDLSDMPTW